MSTTTPKLGLYKPAAGENVNLTTDLNNNWDAIDAKLGPITEDAWTIYTPTWTATGGGTPTVGTGGNAFFGGRYQKIGRTVKGNVVMRFGTAGMSGGAGGSWRFGLPVLARTPDGAIASAGIQSSGFMENDAITGYIIPGVRFSGGFQSVDVLFISESTGAQGSTAVVGPALPFAWGAGDWLTFGFTYESAA